MATITEQDGVRVQTSGPYDDGGTLEFYGPFLVEVIKPFRVSDSYGRETSDGMILVPKGLAFCTRTRHLDAEGNVTEEEYTPLGRNGVKGRSVSREDAPRFLRTLREDGRPIPAQDDPDYLHAQEEWSYRMSR